ncbi:MAG: hypothetical protein NWE93_00425 [Candidatus Bathyarchaeota archaeon]|nr:hypothetical protein [Candidatus Bathyarchaeota archaeon]
MPTSEKLEADYQRFLKSIEDACQAEIEKIRQDLNALKDKAAEIGEAFEFAS